MDERLFYSATERNREPIAKELVPLLPKRGNVLEIASGSGQHAVYFQSRFRNVIWQSSDIDPLCIRSISSWIKNYGLNGEMPEPLKIDVEKTPWALPAEFCKSLKLAVCINMIHISPLSASRSLFENLGQLLQSKSHLFIYGPFKKYGVHTSLSNEQFDQFLKLQDPNWGVRELEEVVNISSIHGFRKIKEISMPANNLSVIFEKL